VGVRGSRTDANHREEQRRRANKQRSPPPSAPTKHPGALCVALFDASSSKRQPLAHLALAALTLRHTVGVAARHAFAQTATVLHTFRERGSSSNWRPSVTRLLDAILRPTVRPLSLWRSNTTLPRALSPHSVEATRAARSQATRHAQPSRPRVPTRVQCTAISLR
jgi:hypothetical protein